MIKAKLTMLETKLIRMFKAFIPKFSLRTQGHVGLSSNWAWFA